MDNNQFSKRLPRTKITIRFTYPASHQNEGVSSSITSIFVGSAIKDFMWSRGSAASICSREIDGEIYEIHEADNASKDVSEIESLFISLIKKNVQSQFPEEPKSNPYEPSS